LDDVEASGLADQVTLSGGEPIMHPDFWRIVNSAGDKGLTVDISTNGTRWSDRDIQELADSDCVTYLQVSIDGATKGTFEAIRGVNSFHALLGTLERFLSLGMDERIDLNMITVVSPVNYHEIRPLADFAESYHFSKLVLGEVMPVGPAKSRYPDLRLSLHQLKTIYADVQEIRKDNSRRTAILTQFYFGFPFDERFRPSTCTLCTGNVATVGPTGDVYLCPYFYDSAFVIGNIEENSLSSILSSQRARQLQERFARRPQRRECSWWSRCGGGCAALAEINGNQDCDPRCPFS
jgi:radical SAM protein with 4Fe4S-binding SPASM domain